MAAVSTPKVSLTSEESLASAWAQIAAKCREEAGWKLNKKPMTVDEVLAPIRPAKPTDATKARAQEMFGKALMCLQRIGELLGSVASMIWSPSQQCINAVKFIVVATREYNKVFENLMDLMERLGVSLGRFARHLEIESEKSGSSLNSTLKIR
jgi:hypothetical protein